MIVFGVSVLIVDCLSHFLSRQIHLSLYLILGPVLPHANQYLPMPSFHTDCDLMQCGFKAISSGLISGHPSHHPDLHSVHLADHIQLVVETFANQCDNADRVFIPHACEWLIVSLV